MPSLGHFFLVSSLPRILSAADTERFLLEARLTPTGLKTQQIY